MLINSTFWGVSHIYFIYTYQYIYVHTHIFIHTHTHTYYFTDIYYIPDIVLVLEITAANEASKNCCHSEAHLLVIVFCWNVLPLSSFSW